MFLWIISFVEPLKKEELIALKHHQTLFKHILILIPFHDTFYKDLKKRYDQWDPNCSTIGDVFCVYGHFFKMYNGFLKNYQRISTLINHLKKTNKPFNNFLNINQSNRVLKGLTLESYLGKKESLSLLCVVLLKRLYINVY